jgi:hypothetical protein
MVKNGDKKWLLESIITWPKKFKKLTFSLQTRRITSSSCVKHKKVLNAIFLKMIGDARKGNTFGSHCTVLMKTWPSSIGF